MMPPIRFHTLRSKLLAGFGVTVALGIGVIAVLSYRQSRESLGEAARASLVQQAASLADKIDRNLFERYGDVQAFAFHPGARGGPVQATQAANFFIQAYGIYDLAIVVGRDGVVLAANTVDHEGKPLDTRPLLGRSVRGEDWFESVAGGRVKRGESFVSDLREDGMVAEIRGGRGLSMNFAAPIFDEGGNMVGVWSNRASWERIGRQMARELLASAGEAGKAMHVQMVNKSGMLIEDRDEAKILKVNLTANGSVAGRGIVNGKDGAGLELESGGIEHLVGYIVEKGYGPYKGHGWGYSSGRRRRQQSGTQPHWAGS